MLVTSVWVVWRVDRDTYSPRLREITIEVSGLARQVDVLQVSDLGGDSFGEGQSKLASLIGDRQFDAIVLTGDILGGRRYTGAWELAALVKRHSERVWYLPGNHDKPKVGKGLAARGVPTLPQDRPVSLLDSDMEGADVALVYGRSSKTIATAKGRGRKLLVIASHTPPDEHRLAAGRAVGDGVHLYISGHTHGGHIRLPFLGAYKAPLSWEYEQRAPAVYTEITTWPEWKGRFVDGMYERNGQMVFVSRGLETHTVGRPRFLARSEMVLFHFVPADK